jgi:hypothetical protein
MLRDVEICVRMHFQCAQFTCSVNVAGTPPAALTAARAKLPVRTTLVLAQAGLIFSHCNLVNLLLHDRTEAF